LSLPRSIVYFHNPPMLDLLRRYFSGRYLQCFVWLGGVVLVWLLTRHENGPLFDWPTISLLTGGLIAGTLLTTRLSKFLPTGLSREQSMPVAAWGLMVMAFMYLGSSAIHDVWFFPTNWRAPGTSLAAKPLDHGMIRALLLMMLLIPFAHRFIDAPKFWAGMTILFAGLAMTNIYKTTGFDMIYRVDSPSFVYRYWCFEQTFPRAGFYDPHWNAGLRIPFLVASGIWSMGVFLLPLLQCISPDRLYTPSLVFFFLVLLPFIAWQSAAWLGMSKRARWIAALLTLASCQRYWVHLLHYGTAPSLFSMAMALPLAALGYKYLYLDRAPRARTIIPLIICGLIMFCWPGSLIIALPFALMVLIHGRQLFPHKWIWILVGVGVIALTMLPLALVPMRYSNLNAFTQTTIAMSLLEHFERGLGVLRHNLRGTNALILIFGVAGSFLWPQRSARWFFGPLIALLLVISGWGEEVKKLLQSERMIIPATLVAIIPAAFWLDKIFGIAANLNASKRANALARTLAVFLVAVLVLGSYQGAKTWRGKGLAPFHAMPAHIKDLIEWIPANVPKDGRVMFAGAAVHGYGGAKIAALPMFTGREMMAADFYGFSPKLVEYQYPPRAFRYSGPDKLFDFMHLHNVTHIITWHADWKKVFHRNPGQYRPVYAAGRIEIFETLRSSSLFLSGQGKVAAGFDRFDVAFDGEPEHVVIKYNWADGLSAQGNARIYPYDAGDGIKFIGIEPGTNQSVTIRYRP
jgi:hypothetical protein